MTLVHTEVVGRVGLINKTLRVMCIHRGTKQYTLVPVTITNACGTVTLEVRVVPNLIHDIIVGWDCLFLMELWDYAAQ